MDQNQPPEEEPPRGITRSQLELVIRRAVELSTASADAQERISEGEVVKIARELGLEPRHVRQALYELPEHEPGEPQSLTTRYFGDSLLQAQRAVPGERNTLLRRLEEYLSTREFLQVRRRLDDRVLFVPAEDVVSSIARAVTRPASRHALARAPRVLLTVRPLEGGRSHVRFDVDLAQRRRTDVRVAILAGIGVGLGAAGGIGVLGAAIAGTLAGPTAAIAGGVVGAITGLFGGFAAVVAALATRFRHHREEATTELEGLLDRLESGERLEPPPSPFWRRMRGRFGINSPFR